MHENSAIKLSETLIDLLSVSFGEYKIGASLRSVIHELFPLLRDMVIVESCAGRPAGLAVFFAPYMRLRIALLIWRILTSPKILWKVLTHSAIGTSPLLYDELQIAGRGYFGWTRILALGVAPQFRQRGIALNLAREIATRHDSVVVMTYSPMVAQRIYGKCGFVRVGKWYNIFSKRHVLLLAYQRVCVR